MPDDVIGVGLFYMEVQGMDWKRRTCWLTVLVLCTGLLVATAQATEVVKKPAPTAVSALNRGEGGVVARTSNPAPEEQGVPGTPELAPEFVATGEILEVPEGTPMIEWPPSDLRELRACTVVYSNMNFPSGTHYYYPFSASATLADDAILTTGSNRAVTEIQLMTYKPSGLAYPITVSVFNDCPPTFGGTGVQLLAPQTQTGIPVGVAATVTFSGFCFMIATDTVWIQVTSTDTAAGWFLNGNTTETGDLGGNGDDFGHVNCAGGGPTCLCYFGGNPYAGFGAQLCAFASCEAGACCNNLTGHCASNVPSSECTNVGERFIPATLCSAIEPLCGKGACCLPATSGNCDGPLDLCCENLYNTTTNGQCTAVSGTWHAGQVCALSSTTEIGFHCPPHHDNCVNADAWAGALPHTFVGRNDGATLDCQDPEAWIAFNTAQCWDIVLSYCGTDPPFGIVYQILYPSCCDIGLYRYRTSITWSSREGDCCKNDPPVTPSMRP